MELEEKMALQEDGVIVTRKDVKMKYRYLVAILGSMGMAIIYGLKVNLSVAMVAMVNTTALELSAANDSKHGDDHHGGDSGGEKMDGPFEWSKQSQGMVLAAYFLGYFVTQIPGGRMAELYSGKWVFLVAVLMNVIGAILSPILSYGSIYALMAIRVFQGFGGGFTFPAMNVLIASWCPPEERSTFSSISFSGASLGTVLSMMSSGIIVKFINWEAIFYIQGILALLWCVMWAVLVTDTPDANRFTSPIEKEYIKGCMPKQTGTIKKPAVPWGALLTSVPFLTLCVAHFCNNFGWYMLLVELPLFAKSGLKVDMTITTIMSSVPFFANWIFSVIYSKTLDICRAKGWISTTIARKISVGFSSILPAICLVSICLVGDQVIAVVTLTVLAVMFYGSMFSGVFSNQADLAPNFAGTLMAVSNMVATIPGFVVPPLVGFMTKGTDGLAPWHTVFYMAVGVLLFEFVLFAILGKGETQKWNAGK